MRPSACRFYSSEIESGGHAPGVCLCLFIQQIFIEGLGPGSTSGPGDKAVPKTDEALPLGGLTFH